MTKRLEFEDSDGTLFDVELGIECRDRDGCDFTWDIEWFALRGEPTEVDAAARLSPKDWKRLQYECEAYASDNACMAAQEYAEGQADYLYDRMRDEEMERGE